jgi:drug/metabolite transporter (DMT)-like permease
MCHNGDMRKPAPHDPGATTARLLIVAAAVLWSSSGLFAKAPHFIGWPGPALAFYRAAFACLILWPLVRSPAWSWRLIPMALCFAAMNYTYLTAMVKGTAANAIWLQSTAPAWVMVVGVFVLREPASHRDWSMLLLCSLGIGLILMCELTTSVPSQTGHRAEAVVWGLLSGVLYAGVILMLRVLRNQDSAWLSAINHTVTVAALMPFLASFPIRPDRTQLWLLAGFGIFQMGLPYFLFARGLRSLPSHQASLIGLVEPVLVPIWVYLAWGEMPQWWTLAGAGLILAGLSLRFIPQRGVFCEDESESAQAACEFGE